MDTSAPFCERPRRLLFVAGENSGDLHASRLIHELRLAQPEIECFGFGGERMAAEGMRLEENLAQKFAIIGLTQVLRNYSKLKALLKRCEQMMEQERPEAVVLVDYPGFNLRVAQTAKRLNIPVIYYISPQIWAWHKSRLQKIARLVDLMLVILPFEEDIYHRASVPVRYVGHPLNDDLSTTRSRSELLAELHLGESKRLVGLLPGSRAPEIIRHLPIMLEAAQKIHEKMDQTEFVIPRASTVARELIEKYVARFPQVPVRIVEQDLKSLRHAMDFAICKSGTSTLELAIAGVPMVIVYKVSLPTYLFAKSVVRIPWIGLVNIVANETVAPELLQGQANPDEISRQVLRYLENPQVLREARNQLARVRAKLGRPGASRRAAESILEVLEERRAQKGAPCEA